MFEYLQIITNDWCSSDSRINVEICVFGWKHADEIAALKALDNGKSYEQWSGALRDWLYDNKNLIIANLTSIRGLASAMGPAIQYSSKAILWDFVKCLGDSKNHMREGNGNFVGSVIGIPTVTGAQKLWLTFQALGDIAFAYPYALILLEFQDTVKSPPQENTITKRASAIAILVTGVFYLGCGCFGYAAFWNDTPGNLLTGFGFYEPYWLIDFANACNLIYLIGGYLLYSQPVFAFVERWLTQKFPNSRFLEKFHELKLPLLPVFRFNMFRLCFRTTYVVTTTAIALVFPYFNEILGVLGSLNLWPLSVYFPVEMYIVQRKVEVRSRKWVFLEIFNGALMVVSVMALVGSVAGQIEAKMK